MSDPDPGLADVVALERRLLDPGTRADPRQVADLLHPGFREVGASGRTWDRESIAAALAADPGGPVGVTALEVVRVSDGVVHLTYLAAPADGARSWRSSLWVRLDGRWRLRFHQGTPAAPGT